MGFRFRTLCLGAVCLALLLLLAPLAAHAAPHPLQGKQGAWLSFAWGSYSAVGATAYGVRDIDNTTVLHTGALVQLVYAGADGQRDPPTCDGWPSDDDELLQTGAVQNAGALPPSLRNKGYIPQRTLLLDSADPRIGGLVYLRAWNAASAQTATAWGDSTSATLIPGAVLNASSWRTMNAAVGGSKGCKAANAAEATGRRPDTPTLQPPRRVAGHAAIGDTAPAPTWYLLAWPLLVYDATLEEALGPQLHGTESPDTADRVLVWDGVNQSYHTAWFCGGPLCKSWGEPWANHWLAEDYSRSTLTLPPDTGFWIENRSGGAEALSVAGDVADADRSVPVGTGWQLLGSAIPISRGLDDAGFPATDGGSPETADQVFYWDASTQEYRSAWYCGGPSCEWTNGWLNDNNLPTDIVLEPGHGFWYLNRHASFNWVNPR